MSSNAAAARFWLQSATSHYDFSLDEYLRFKITSIICTYIKTQPKCKHKSRDRSLKILCYVRII